MADAVIEILGHDEFPLVVELVNQFARPAQSGDAIRRRYLGRDEGLQLTARLDGRPVGLLLGAEVNPDVFAAHFSGVVEDARRLGIGSQLLEAAEGWASENEYATMRLECPNRQRPMLHLAIEKGYDIVGTRYDADRAASVVIFEKQLGA